MITVQKRLRTFCSKHSETLHLTYSTDGCTSNGTHFKLKWKHLVSHHASSIVSVKKCSEGDVCQSSDRISWDLQITPKKCVCGLAGKMSWRVRKRWYDGGLISSQSVWVMLYCRHHSALETKMNAGLCFVRFGFLVSVFFFPWKYENKSTLPASGRQQSEMCER